MPIDPVCKMSVKPENAAVKVEYIGRVYYFCSRECHQYFTANLQHYASAPEEGAARARLMDAMFSARGAA